MNARDTDSHRDRRPHGDAPVSELMLEQYLLGELPEAYQERVKTFVATAEGARRLAALEASNATLLERHPPALFAATQERARRLAAASTRRPRVGLWVLAPLAAAAALLVWAFWPTLPNDSLPASQPNAPAYSEAADPAAADPAAAGAMARRDPDTEQTRAKGLRPYLVIHKQDGRGGATRLKDGALAHAGDVVQISYVASAQPHGVVLSIDGRGAVTLHFPEAPNASTALENTGQTTLTHAYELDDAPSFERFIFITAPHPIAVENALSAARVLATQGDALRTPLMLPADLEQASFTLRKER